MQAFTTHTGLVAPMDRENVDTDAIIPKQFLKSIHKTGFGPNLFDEWRYLDVGQPGQNPQSRKPNPDFVLNQPRYQGASILLARKNFGCGSSREHAPWAIEQFGFRALIAPSFADIFFNNCFKNGLLPIVLPERTVAQLFDACHAFPGFQLTIELAEQRILTPEGVAIPFEVNPFRKECLLGSLLYTSALGNILTRQFGRVNPLALVIWGNVFAAPALILLALGFEGPALMLRSVHQVHWPSLAALAYTTYLSGILGYGIWSWLLARYQSGAIVPMTLLVPVVGMTAAALILHEQLQPWKLFAALLVMTGLVINSFGDRIWRSLTQRSR